MVMDSGKGISVIIPTLSEADHLPATLESVIRAGRSAELIVVDGGSADGTIAIARGFGARVLETKVRQRAAQMNLGAFQSRGETLFFLHGDTRIPQTAFAAVHSWMRHPRAVGGAFARRFDHPSYFLKLTCRLAEWRGRLNGWFLGDQGIFVRRTTFEHLKGFPPWEIFEDLEFSRRMAGEGKVRLLHPPVLSSGRRFGLHPMRCTWRDLVLTCRFLSHSHRRRRFWVQATDEAQTRN